MNLQSSSYTQLNKITEKNNTERVLRMSAAAEKFTHYLEEKVGIIPQFPNKAAESTWIKYLTKSPEEQDAAAKGIESAIEFINSAEQEGISVKDDAGLLTFAARQMRLSLEDDLINKIEPGDLVEVINKDGVQLYRNFNFFNYSNYSIVDLVTYPWYELYERSSSITDYLMDCVARISRNETQFVDLTESLAPYTLKELLTEGKSVFKIREKFLAQMRHWPSGEVYILCVKRVEELPYAKKLSYI